MFAVLRHGRHRSRRSIVNAAVLSLAVSAAASLSAIAPTSDPATGAAPDRARSGTQRVVALDGQAAAAPRRAAPVPGTAPAVTPAAPVAAGVTRPAVTTMSMDVPIQGGLTARQAQAASAAVRAAHDPARVAAAADSWTPAMGRTAVARARSWLGLPYSWAGGSASGPTAGRCDTSNGADLDCRIVGFDCSGLMMYAWGPYASLPHFAQTQREAGEFHPSVKQLRPGDMVFFAGYIPDGIGHVAIYEGDGMVIEAPQSGSVVRRSALADLIAHNGAYRGAVRPLTAATPTLLAPTDAVPQRGGTVTLRGSHLAGVTSLTVGDRTVTKFTRRSDSAVVIRVPRSPADRTITVTAHTPWGATSQPISMRYAKPVTSTPKPAPPTSSAPHPTAPKPTTGPKPTTPPKTSPPKPTPPKTSPAPTAPPSTGAGTATSAPASGATSAAVATNPTD